MSPAHRQVPAYDDGPGEPEGPSGGVAGLGEDVEVTVDRRADLAIAVAVTALGVAVVYLSRDIRRGAIPDPIGSGGFAQVLGAFVALMGVVLIARRVSSWRTAVNGQVSAEGGSGDEPGLPVAGTRPFVMLVIGCGWALGLNQVGFIVATWVASGLAMVAMRTRSVRKLVVIPVTFSLFCWLLFTRVSGLRFPAGPIDQLLAELVPRLN